MSERLSYSLDGSLPGITPFHTRPGPGLVQQCAELRQQLGSSGAGTVERFDPLQSLQHSPCLVHASDGSAEAFEDG